MAAMGYAALLGGTLVYTGGLGYRGWVKGWSLSRRSGRMLKGGRNSEVFPRLEFELINGQGFRSV
jgi:hypothetical protein